MRAKKEKGRPEGRPEVLGGNAHRAQASSRQGRHDAPHNIGALRQGIK